MDNTSFEPDVEPQSTQSNGRKTPADDLPGPTVDSTSIDMPKEKLVADKPYAGMGKEDLLRFSQTPFWNRLRLISLVSSIKLRLGKLVAEKMCLVMRKEHHSLFYRKLRLISVYSK